MKVNVAVEVTTESLDGADHAGQWVLDALLLRLVLVEAHQRVGKLLEHSERQVVVEKHEVAQIQRKAQNPLADRHHWEHFVDEMGRALGCSACHAARANPAASFAGEG